MAAAPGPMSFIGPFPGSLARYKVPRKVCPEEVLHKNAVGKVAKPVLRPRLGDLIAHCPLLRDPLRTHFSRKEAPYEHQSRCRGGTHT